MLNNQDPRYIHETVIRDIVDIAVDAKDALDNDELFQGFKNKKSFKSIASASSNLTLVFPVLTSKTINIENAMMVSKAIERKAVTMLQMLFSALCISDTDDGMKYIQQFHHNLKMDDKITVDNFITTMDKFTDEAGDLVSVADPKQFKAIEEDLRNLSYILPDSLNETSLNDFYVNPRINSNKVLKEAKDNGSTNFNKDSNPIIYNISDNRRTTPGRTAGGSSVKDAMEYFKNQLLPNDVKKSNELVPTTMVVNFISRKDGEPVNTQIVIGVKAKIYPIDSMDIINRLIIHNKNKNVLLQFIKSTTREISFVRDFLFAIDKAKVDALSNSKRGSSSKIWKLLERRSLKSKVRRALGQINDASAITSLVMSQEEVDYLIKEENIDVSDPSIIRPIMESLNFISVVILDDASEVAKFIWDTGDDIYETISYRGLEREGSNTGNDYKKIVNLVSRMR